MSNEQGLVERLRDDARAFTRRLGIEPERSIGWEAADRLEAQAAEIAELRAEVERVREGEARLSLQLNDTAREASAQIADLKRALDTARHDAMDAARYRWLRKQHWHESTVAVVSEPKQNVKLGSYCPSDKQLDEVIDAALSLSASPLSQGGQADG